MSSNACLPDGSCADEQQVAYVAAGGSGTICTKTTPCGTLDAGLKTHKAFVKVAAGAVADSNITTIDGQTVTILAEKGAQLSRTVAGTTLQVQNDGADVKIFDLQIINGIGAANAAISLSNPNGGTPRLTLTRVTVDGNQGSGVTVMAGTLTVSESTINNNQGSGISTTGGSLAVSQSTISNNQGLGISAATGTVAVSRSTIFNNAGGGISVTGASSIFDISQSFIVYNGRASLAQSSDVGGIALTANTMESKFEWNTVALNQSNGLTFRGGVSCNGPMASASGNLIYHNSEPDGAGGTKTDAATQKNSGGCQYGNSVAIATDTNSLGFKSALIMPFDFHLTGATPASIVNAAGTCSGIDFDGQSRPIGTACDLGADEYQPAP